MENINQYWNYVTDPIRTLWQRVATALPDLIGALVLLVVGYVLAKVLAWVAERALARMGVDTLSERTGIQSIAERLGWRKPLSGIAASLLFAFVFLAFVLAAGDALRLSVAATAITQVMLFLPKLLAALVVLLCGLVVASWLSKRVRATAEGMDIDYASTLEKAVFGVLAALVVLLAVDQLGMRIILVQEIIGIVLAAFGLALAISLGLGTRDLSGQMVSGVYVKDFLQTGDYVEIGGLRGAVVEVGSIKTTLVLEDGRRLSIPNKRLLEQNITVARKDQPEG